MNSIFRYPPILPYEEMAAYEALWLHEKTSFKAIADQFRKNSGYIPSELVTEEELRLAYEQVSLIFSQMEINDYGFRINGTIDYPNRLRDAVNPVELLYYRGLWDIIESPKRVAVVGTRNPSEEGIRRTKKLVKLLVQDGYTIVSGLARGVDTIAHTTAIEAGGVTVAVIGTPITEYYPPENRALQDRIAKDYLLISQIPILKYKKQNPTTNRFFFPERNATMSALTQATIIVEAGNTSGTLTQARAAIYQGRKLFILDSCFQNKSLTWPRRLEEQGAIRVREYSDISEALALDAITKN